MYNCVSAAHAPAFEKMVDLHNGDEIKAFEEYEKNGLQPSDEARALVGEDIVNNEFTVSEHIETNPIILSKQNAVRKVKATLFAKIKALTRLSEKHSGFEKAREELQGLLDDIDEVSAEETLVGYIGAASNMVANVEKWFKSFQDGSKVPTFENLKRIDDYVSSIALLKDLRKDMFDDPKNQDYFNTVEEILGKYGSLHNIYISESRKLLADKLKGNFNKVVAMYERDAEIAFNKYKKPYVEKSMVAEAKAEFISNYMVSKATEIELRTHQYVENMLLQVVDIPTLSAWAVNPKDMNHDIISIAVESLDKADMEIWSTMETIVDDSEEINEAFVNHVGKSGDPKKQYEILFLRDKEGNILPEIVSMEGDFKQYQAFKDKYEGVPAVWNMYQHLAKLAEEKNRMTYTAGRLDLKLPRLEQGNLERLYSNGILSFVKEGFLDKFKLRGKDVELGIISDEALEAKKIKKAKHTEDTYVDESGEERSSIPLHYRNTNIPNESISYDVMRSMVLDYHNCLKFKVKTETAVFLDVLKDVMHEVDILQTTSFVQKLKINKETGETHTTKKGVSNITATLEMLIRHRVYGIAIEGDPTVTKIFQTIGNYTSLLAMSANIVSGTANLAQGTVVGWIETAGGKTGYFTPSNRKRASVIYNSQIPQFMKDIGERVPKSKVNLVARKFNVFSETNLLNGKSYTQNTKIKRIAEQSALMAFNGMGEHALQSINMLAILDNIKVKDVNGSFLDKDFKPTTDRSQAIGVYDAMLQEGTKLEFHPSVNSTERTKGVSDEDMVKIHRMITRVSRDIYGNYASQNKARYQRTAVGAMMGSMRGYLISGAQKRFRGIGTSGLLSKDGYTALDEEFTFDNLHRLSYNTEIDKFEQGQYVTTAKFVRDMITEVKALKSIAGTKEAWNSMTDEQKANVRKTLIELGAIVAFWLLANLFHDDPDDNDDIENLYVAYLSRRMFSELSTFTNINETIRTFRSPAVAIGTVENVLKALLQTVSDPTEVYDGGRHSGEYKLWRDIKKLIPVYKQVDRNIEDSYAFLIR